MSDQLEPELERVAQMLAHAGPLPDAPATLRERALAIPDGGEAAVEPDEAVPTCTPRVASGRGRSRSGDSRPPSRRSRSSRRSCSPQGGGDEAQRIDLAPRSFAPAGRRRRARRRARRRSSTISLTVWKMPSAGSGRTYEAWLGRTGDRRPLGTFSTDASGKATITFRVTNKEYGHYRWLWVTSEPTGGSTQPSGKTALWGPLT